MESRNKVPVLAGKKRQLDRTKTIFSDILGDILKKKKKKICNITKPTQQADFNN